MYESEHTIKVLIVTKTNKKGKDLLSSVFIQMLIQTTIHKQHISVKNLGKCMMEKTKTTTKGERARGGGVKKIG